MAEADVKSEVMNLLEAEPGAGQTGSTVPLQPDIPAVRE